MKRFTKPYTWLALVSLLVFTLSLSGTVKAAPPFSPNNGHTPYQYSGVWVSAHRDFSALTNRLEISYAGKNLTVHAYGGSSGTNDLGTKTVTYSGDPVNLTFVDGPYYWVQLSLGLDSSNQRLGVSFVDSENKSGSGILHRESATDYDGIWETEYPNTNGVSELNISNYFSNLAILGWGDCYLCDWGTQYTYYYPAHVTFNYLGFSHQLSIINFGDALYVTEVYNGQTNSYFLYAVS